MKLTEEDQSFIVLVSAAVFMFTVGVVSVVTVIIELAYQKQLTSNSYSQFYDSNALQVLGKTRCNNIAE